MSTISDVSSSTLSNYTDASTGSAALDETDFLTLLVAQLENQDPLDPQDNSEFIAQLAQFSSLEQATTTNNNLEALLSSNQAIEQLSAFNLLGQTVTAEQSTFKLGDEPVEIGFDLEYSAETVSLSILDESNSVVSNIEVKDLNAGINFLSWDGTDTAGNNLPSGDYKVLATAIYDNNSSSVLTTLQRAQVTGIETGSETLLETSQGYLELSQLRSVNSF
jgi:flagellar basal-body rod modification protein FlgD